MNVLLWAAVAAASATLILMPIMRWAALRCGYLDVPNDRSAHAQPTPRTGGYAILLGIVSGVAVSASPFDLRVGLILLGASMLAIAAFVDDRRVMPRIARLGIQFAVAALVIWGLLFATPHPWRDNPALLAVGTIGAVIWLVGVINAYNFMDGLNGMAGVAAAVTGTALALMALWRGDVPAAALAIAAAAAAAAFLPFNLFNGSVFMGDSGATALGLVFGALVVNATRAGGVPIMEALPVMSFVLDAGTTVVRRALRGERFFATRHRSSYYQLLQQLGWSHAAVAGVYGLLTLISASVALSLGGLSTVQRTVALASLAVIHIALFTWIQTRWSRQSP